VRARPSHRPAFLAHVDFLKVGHFALFSQFLHFKGRNFPDVFKPRKVSWKSVRMFLRNLERRHTDAAAWTDRCGNFIYIEATNTPRIIQYIWLQTAAASTSLSKVTMLCLLDSACKTQRLHTDTVAVPSIDCHHEHQHCADVARSQLPCLIGDWWGTQYFLQLVEKSHLRMVACAVEKQQVCAIHRF